MIKAKAYQVAPEYQHSPLDDYGCCELHAMAIVGNKDFKAYTCDEYDVVDAFVEERLNGELHSVPSSLPRLDKAPYSDWEIQYIESVCNQYIKGRISRNQAITEIISLYTKHHWTYKTIRGTVQSEWQILLYDTIIYPIGDARIDEIEKAYFNLGTEWEITFIDENEEYIASHYSYKDRPEEIKQDIAEAVELDVSEIEFHQFDGWTRTPKYKTF